MAFEACYDQYAAALLGDIERALYNKKTSEEILIRVFREIYNRIEEYDPSKVQLFTWMLQITRRLTRTAKIDLVIKEIFLCQEKIYVPDNRNPALADY